MRILVLDGINKNALAIIRYFGRLGVGQLDAVFYMKFSISYYSKFVVNKYILPNPKTNEKEFIPELLKLLEKEKFDLILPVGYKTYYLCSQYQDKIKKFTGLIITTFDNIKLASNKILTYQFAEKIGLSIPKTFYINDINEIKNLELSFPVVIKGPYESGKNIVKYIKNKNNLEKEYHKLVKDYGFKDHLPLIQEKIKGGGYGFFAYYENGKCIKYFMHKRIREYPVKGGASVCAEGFYDEELKKSGELILDSLKWNGVAMVEFKKDIRDNKYKLMEINPKFWGSLELSIFSGIIFPYYIVQRAMNKEISPGNDYNKIRFQWILNGELFHAIENPGSIIRIFRDFFHSKNDISLTDIKPNLFQILLIIDHFYKKLKNLIK